MRTGVAIVVGALLLIGFCISMAIYGNQKVVIDQEVRYVCDEPGHQGPRVMKTEMRSIEVARNRARQAAVVEESQPCPACAKMAKAEAERREREAQEAREKEEAEKIFKNLEVKFGFTSWSSGPGPQIVNEISLTPGHELMPTVSVKNLGQEPISGLRFVIKDDDNCLSYRIPEMVSFGLDEADHLAREASNRKKKKLIVQAFKDLFCRGVPISDGPLNPYGKYSNDVGGFSGDVPLDEPFEYMTKFGPMGAPERSINMRTILIVRPDLAPGQDRHFAGYLICKGVRRHIGMVTVHVMYS